MHQTRHIFYFDTSCKRRIEDGAMIIGGLVLVNTVLLNTSGNKVKEQFWENLVSKFSEKIWHFVTCHGH